jgi:hypothetical protein
MDRRIALFFTPVRMFSLLLLLPLLFLNACGGGGGGSSTLINAQVSAAQGGTFADKSVDPLFSLTIPPGALSSDARLVVTAVTDTPQAGTNQTQASGAFAVSLVSLNGTLLTISEDLILKMAANPAPVHPQLGEIAKLSGSTWQRMRANFFRSSDKSVVALVSEPNGTFRVLHRTLQTSSGSGVAAGFEVFMNETFGNENFFGGVLGLHTVLNSLTPSQAVALGVQVDLAKVPADIVAVMTGTDLAAKDAALANPVITQRLLKAGAVIGVKGVFATADPNDITLTAAGITCALCHQNVTPTTFTLSAGSTALPIGPLQIDGKANVAMNAGAIIAATPFVQSNPSLVTTLQGWGPGRFDIRALPDNPLDDAADNPTGNPPLWNFVDLQLQGYLLGYDGLFVGNNALASQAEAVYDLVMHANGAFGIAVGGQFGVAGAGNLPPALRITPPQSLVDALVAAETGQPGNDINTQKLLDLQTWMQSLTSPAPGSFDETKAEQGFKLFFGKANCHVCHDTADLTNSQGSLFTFTLGPNPGDLAGGIKVPGLRGVSNSAPYLHNHGLATLEEVVSLLATLGAPIPALTAVEQAALVEFLKSI